MLMADKEEKLKSMLVRMEGYLDKKRLEINVKNTKVLNLRKEGEDEEEMLEIEREENRRGKRILLYKIHIAEDWGARGTG